MKRPAFLLAVALVLLSNVFVLVHAWRNRGGDSTSMELTERELRLARVNKDSSALFLDMNWRSWGREHDVLTMEWFDEAKLAEVGFNCRVPATGPEAYRHYSSMPPREAFVVMEYRPEQQVKRAAWMPSRLFAVDVGREYEALRKKYPDTGRFLIAPGLVRIRLSVEDVGPPGAPPNKGRLRGWVMQALVERIAVPAECRSMFLGLKEQPPAKEGQEPEPRYAVVLRYGRLHEPWVESCRLLPVSTQ